MPNPYREIFSAPGAKGFSAAGFIARLPLAMATIGIVAMLSQTHGEYWLAGAVSATFALANALISPRISRLVDRHGQARVLMPATTISVAAFALIVATHYDAPIWTLFAFAVVAGVDAEHDGDGPGALDGNLPRHAEAAHGLRLRIRRRRSRLYGRADASAIGLSVSFFPEAGPLDVDRLPGGRRGAVRRPEIDRATVPAGSEKAARSAIRPAARSQS